MYDVVGYLTPCPNLIDRNNIIMGEGRTVKKKFSGVKKRLSEIIGTVGFGTFKPSTMELCANCNVTGWYVELSDGSGKVALTDEFEVV